jgi:uncharacterized protein (TIGR02246 family)
MKRTWRFVAAACVLVAAGLIFAQNKSASTGDASSRPADEKAIREAAQGLARAFEKGDAKAMAAFWTEEGEYVDESGTPVRGRAALEKAYLDFFAKRPELKVESKTDSIRFIGKDAAVEEGTFTVHAKSSPPNTSRYSALHVRQDGRWLVALLKEWGDDEANRAKLDDLAWLIGTWKSESGDVQAQTEYEWAENKKFIRCKYTVTNKKDKATPGSGTQVIGIDPARGLIRAWTFDSEGGIGEATWTLEGNRWVIDSSGTLVDGSETTATNLLQRKGDNAFTWRSVQRTLENEKLPDLGPIQVTRVKK